MVSVSWIPNPYERGHLAVVVDCADLERAARFWAGALGYVSPRPGSDAYRSVLPADGPGVEILLQRTGDAKHAKNRVHLDLRTRDLDAEVRRVAALGATVLTPSPIAEHGWRWHVLADPDGNEFCVLQPPASYWDNPAGELPDRGGERRPDDPGARGRPLLVVERAVRRAGDRRARPLADRPPRPGDLSGHFGLANLYGSRKPGLPGRPRHVFLSLRTIFLSVPTILTADLSGICQPN